jgi:16S rRNA processing protein RimM
MADRLCVGVVIGAHGVKGQLRIKSFTADPLDLIRYGRLETEAGAVWRLQGASAGVKGVVTARVDAIGDHTQAEAVKGVKLYVDRAALPAPDEEEFYVADLVGLAAWSKEGAELGTVTAVFDFGAGDIIEVTGPAGALLLPFTRTVVPVVDLAGGRVVIDPPLAEEDEEERPPHGA